MYIYLDYAVYLPDVCGYVEAEANFMKIKIVYRTLSGFHPIPAEN